MTNIVVGGLVAACGRRVRVEQELVVGGESRHCYIRSRRKRSRERVRRWSRNGEGRGREGRSYLNEALFCLSNRFIDL